MLKDIYKKKALIVGLIKEIFTHTISETCTLFNIKMGVVYGYR